MLHLIGRVRRDLCYCASFDEFLALAFGWPALFVGQFVESFSFVVVIVCYQKSVGVPCSDGAGVDVEFVGDFILGEQAGFAQAVGPEN